MILEIQNGELIMASESQAEFMVLCKLDEKLLCTELDSVQRCLTIKTTEYMEKEDVVIESELGLKHSSPTNLNNNSVSVQLEVRV